MLMQETVNERAAKRKLRTPFLLEALYRAQKETIKKQHVEEFELHRVAESVQDQVMRRFGKPPTYTFDGEILLGGAWSRELHEDFTILDARNAFPHQIRMPKTATFYKIAEWRPYYNAAVHHLPNAALGIVTFGEATRNGPVTYKLYDSDPYIDIQDGEYFGAGGHCIALTDVGVATVEALEYIRRNLQAGDITEPTGKDVERLRQKAYARMPPQYGAGVFANQFLPAFLDIPQQDLDSIFAEATKNVRKDQ